MDKKVIQSASTILLIIQLCIISNAQVRAIYDRGSVGLEQKLERLQTNASVLHTGAHPDDEDSGLLAYLARNEHARTAYLSLNRGDGGQNVIGNELFESLGVIRTEELLQARRLDGAEQLFTSVMDYGYSKKRAEAASLWGEQLVLKDMVRAIRLFKPLVIISRFSGTPRDGHGQHQLAGYLTPIAYKMAADPLMFPDQIKSGLEPWQALKLYRSGSFRPDPNNPPTLKLTTGKYSPLLGRSYFEIAMEGRSQHKSQRMGTLELRGEFQSSLLLLDKKIPVPAKESSVFDGIDTSLSGFSKLIPNVETEYSEHLLMAQEHAANALGFYKKSLISECITELVGGYKDMQMALDSSHNAAAKDFASRKKDEFADAVKLASGIVIDALASDETVNPGGSTNISVKFFAPHATKLMISKVRIESTTNWRIEQNEKPINGQTRSRRRNDIPRSEFYFQAMAPMDAKPTAPYWLESPTNDNSTFNWENAGNSKNQPFAPPLLIAHAILEIAGEKFEYTQPVEFRYDDDIRGEIRREINVVPKVTIGLDSNLLIAPQSPKATNYNVLVTVRNNTPAEIEGDAHLALPTGWKMKSINSHFKLSNPGDSTTINFTVTIPGRSPVGRYHIKAYADVGGKKFDQQMQTIAYPHIQTHRIYSEANLTAELLALKVAPVKVGYVMGSGDRVPDAIKRLGLDVSMLDKRELAVGDLNKYDTILIGIRASQVRPDFVANNDRLLDFVKQGGTLIVQYQQYDYPRLGLAPFPVKMNSNSRAVDENAKVSILQPDNVIFNFPNKITERDFDNWVQERHLYSLNEWSEEYTPLLESHDEGEKEAKGGMLFARVGKGVFIYSSYSWFRQLPKGVPGAYRILSNMLSVPKSENH